MGLLLISGREAYAVAEKASEKQRPLETTTAATRTEVLVGEEVAIPWAALERLLEREQLLLVASLRAKLCDLRLLIPTINGISKDYRLKNTREYLIEESC